MPFNGSGGTTQPASSLYPAVASTLIQSAKANVSIADLYAMLASCLLKDGQQVATQRIPFAVGISTDTIAEKTVGAGVTVDSVLLKAGGATLTALLSAVNATFSGTVALTGAISPAQLVANTNDWAPTGLSGASVIRFSTDARRNITGLTGGATGRLVTLHNVGTFPAVFTYQDVLSSAANRFAFHCTLGGGQSMEIVYDATSALWRGKTLPEPIGTIKDFGTSTMPGGYLAVDQNVSRTTYASLFNEVGTTWGAGDLSTTFGLFVGAGRALIAAGTGTISEAVAFGSVSTGSDNFTVASNDKKWITGQPVVLTTTGGLPAGLALATTYYLVRSSATLIQFASSLANAQNGTVIDLTTQGTGTHTVTGTLTARTHGELLGMEDHPMTITQLLAHNHTDTGHAHTAAIRNAPAGASTTAVEANANPGDAVVTTSTASAVITNTGGNQAMNNMQPSAVVTRGIRYC